jgi:hypothetical protein
MYPRAFVDYFNRECEDELNDWFRFDEVCRKDIAESVHDGVELRAGGTWGRLGSRCDDISAAGKGSDVRRCSIAAE